MEFRRLLHLRRPRTHLCNDHFVNFVDNVTTPVAPYWICLRSAYFNWFVASGRIGGPYANKYEGDAAIGWFNSNQSSYPVSTIFDNLTFEDVDLRHQVFTDLVNFGNFNDGDKNTAIVDRDGSLTGYSVLESDGATTPSDVFPISLNNLGFNYTSNSADECLSEGAQNAAVEGRPTSVISPGDIGSLGFEALWPTPDKDEHIQWIKFTTDDQFGVTGGPPIRPCFFTVAMVSAYGSRRLPAATAIPYPSPPPRRLHPRSLSPRMQVFRALWTSALPMRALAQAASPALPPRCLLL